MNRLFFFWVAALLHVVLFSCKEEVDATDTAGNAVGFSISPISRVAELTESGLKASGFRVSAYSTGADNWATAKDNANTTPGFMHDQPVTWDSTNSVWTYTPTKYWPGRADGVSLGKVSFFAWSKNVESIASVSGETTAGAPALTVTVPNAQADQKDLVADVLVDETSETVTSTGGVVPFEFSHILSRIGFTARLKEQYANTTVKITSLMVSYGAGANKVESKGVYTFGDSHHAAGEWTYPTDGSNTYMSNTAGDEVVADLANGVTLNNDATPTVTRVNGDDRYLMLLPQTIGAGAVLLEVTWTVDGAAKTYTVSLPRQVWSPGKCHDYNLIVGKTGIALGAVAVNPWGGADQYKTTYTITYDANGGTGAGVEQQLVTNVAYPLWDGNTFTPPTVNHIFDGWSTQSDGSGEDYWEGDSFMHTSGDPVTLYAQWVAPPVALANCYVVAPGDRVYFPVARAYESGNTLRTGGTYDGSFAAEVVWQDVAGLVTPSIALDAGKDSWVRIRTHGSTPGNAVVKIYKAGDTTKTPVWSYHIWVTDYTGATTWTNPNQMAYTFMDRNLGATEAGLSSAAYGLLYQWCRKDPFPGGASGMAGFAALDKFYGMPDADNKTYTVSSSANAGAIVESIQNPTTFYAVKANDDWLPSLTSNLWSTNGLKSGGKTIYDPCPSGWRVPARVAISYSDNDSPWKGLPKVTFNNGCNWGINAIYPAAGGRASTRAYNGSYGYYFSASIYDNGNQASYLFFDSTGHSGSVYTSRVFGRSVRCVKE